MLQLFESRTFQQLGEHIPDSEVDLIKDDTRFRIGIRPPLNAPELDKSVAADLPRQGS